MTFYTSRHGRRSVLVAVSTTAAMLIASIAPAVAKDKPKPFKASIEFVETLALGGGPDCFPTRAETMPATGTISGSGEATHMGRVSARSADCILFSTPMPPKPPGPSEFSTLKGTTAVLTAANGDQLFLTYAGTATPQPEGVLDLSGRFVITGGTGRFADATGDGTLEGVEDISTAPARGSLLLSGSISY